MPALQIIYRLMTGITNHSFAIFVLIFMHKLIATVSLPACAAAPEAERRALPDHRGQDRLALVVPCTDEVRSTEVGGSHHHRHGVAAKSSVCGPALPRLRPGQCNVEVAVAGRGIAVTQESIQGWYQRLGNRSAAI
jgi:hypothetical protein